MSFKRRFALLFTCFVAVILLVSCASIYFLYENYRKEDFRKRVLDEANVLYRLYASREQKDTVGFHQFIRQVHTNGMFDEQFFIRDDNGQLLFVLNDTLPVLIAPALEEKVKLTGTYFYQVGKRQSVGIYVPAARSFVYASGFDRSGLKRLSNLRLILLVVFGCGLTVSVLFSFSFVQQAIKPLKRLSKQMEDTSVVNLTERVTETGSFEEVNQIARNFNATLERLNKAFEFQKNFVHNASHELRTPLANMLAQTEAALRNTLTEEEYRNVLGSLRQDQQRMIDLTNALLLISLYEQEGYDKNWPMCRMDEIIYEKISNSKRLFPDIGLSLTFLNNPNADDELMIKANDSLLKSVFNNLIRNAYTYSPNKKVDILLEFFPKEIKVHFENKGTRLSPEEQERIMMPFFRGQNAQQTKGFGLGLSIVQRILKMHNGQLTYEALPNQINRFTVSLPRNTESIHEVKA